MKTLHCKSNAARQGLAILLAGALLVPTLPAQPFVLHDGTTIRLRLNRNVSSADAKVGEPVDFEVVEDILVNGAVIIQRGSTALATITEAKAKGRMGKSGKLNVNIDHARSILGEKITLRAVKDTEGGGNTGKMTGAIVATSIVFFPAAPLFLFMKGKDITIPKGTEITAYVHGDVRLDEARFRAHPANAALNASSAAPAAPAAPTAAPAAPAAAPAARPPAPPAVSAAPPPAPPPTSAAAGAPQSGMSNGEVLELKKAGFSDDLIVSKIRSSQCAFRLETGDMIELKKSGLSDKVIGAMMAKTR